MIDATRTTRVGRHGASVDGARTSGDRPRAEGRAARPGGFTITELLVTIIILFLLITMLVVAVNRARSIAATNAERQTVASLKIGVEQFQGEFGFLPPLVKDDPHPSKYAGWDAPIDGEGPLDDDFNPVVFSTGDQADLDFLRGGASIGDGNDPTEKDYRFSEYSIPYYLMGVLGVSPDDEPIDGVDGRDSASRAATGRSPSPAASSSRSSPRRPPPRAWWR